MGHFYISSVWALFPHYLAGKEEWCGCMSFVSGQTSSPYGIHLSECVLLLVCSCWRTLSGLEEQEKVSLKHLIAAVDVTSCSVHSVDIVTSCTSPAWSPDHVLCTVSQKAAGARCTSMALRSFTDASFLVLLSGTTLWERDFQSYAINLKVPVRLAATKYLRDSCPVWTQEEAWTRGGRGTTTCSIPLS